MLDAFIARLTGRVRCGGCGECMPADEYAAHSGLRTKNGAARCRFCHRWIALGDIGRHEARHMVRGPGGQMASHITLPPDERFDGDLSDVPQTDVHRRCGEATGMPESIVRSDRVNPFPYGGTTLCTHCEDDFLEREMSWVETGEALDDYTARLQADWLTGRGPDTPPCPY